MEKDVLISFYLAILKNQLCELQLLRLKNDDSNFAINTPEVELTRRELSVATFNLVRAALPTTLRHKRLFRTKYVDEVDLPNMENNLVSTANKVLNFTNIPALADYDLVPAQPSAQEFINTFNRVQGLVISIIETALTNSYPVSVNNKSSESISNRIEMFDQSEFVLGIESSTLLNHCHPRHSALSGQDFTFREVVVQVKIGSIKYTSTARLPLSSSSYLSISPELFDALLELDRYAAYFEYEFVRCLSHRFRTIQEAEDLQMVTVLFSETLMWALAVKLLSVQQLAERDPCILLAIPRLAILVGCRILPDSPIGANRLATGQRLPFMFSLSRSELAYLSRQLYALRPDQLCRLTRWLGPNGLPNLIHNQTVKQTNMHTVTTTVTSNSSITTSPESRTNRIRPTEQIKQEQLEETQSQQNQTVIMSNDCSNTIPQSYSPTTNYKIDLPKKVVWKTCLMGLHKLYKCISNVADCFSREFPTELRFILQKVIEMHDNSNEEAALAELEQMNNPNVSNDINKINLSNKKDQLNAGLNAANKVDKVNDDNDNMENDDGDNNDNNGDLTELEEEIDLDTSLLQSEHEFKNLSNLFNWIEVMKLTNNDQFNLIKMYKKSFLIFPHKHSVRSNSNLNKQNSNFDKSILIHENDSTLKIDFLTITNNNSTITTTTANSLTTSVRKFLQPIDNPSKNISMEVGIDITSYLNDSTETYSSELLSPPMYPLLSSPSPLRPNLVNSLYYEDLKNKSNGFDRKSNNRSAVFQHLSTLNLGFSVDGNHNTNEYLFNYLPPWQPDTPILDSTTDNFKDDSDNDFDHSSITSENGEQNSFTVGKQCATCHRTFTIIRRRHHCRRCGHIFCSRCCNQWQSIDGLATNKPVRICMECYEFLNPEIK